MCVTNTISNFQQSQPSMPSDRDIFVEKSDFFDWIIAYNHNNNQWSLHGQKNVQSLPKKYQKKIFRQDT